MQPAALPPSGRLVARSTVRVAPPGFPNSYGVGVVELLPDLRVMARFRDGVPEHGALVSVSTGRLRDDHGEEVLGPVFAPDPSASLVGVDRQFGDGGYSPRAPREPLAVAIAGVATTAFGRPDRSAEELAGSAALAAVADAGLDLQDVDAVVVGSAFSTAALGQRMLRHVPWGGRRLVNVENACASGTSALSEAVALIRAGMADVVVAVGADTPVRSGGGLIPLDRDDPVAGIGVTLPALYAMVADHYQHLYGSNTDGFAEVVVRSRRNAEHNDRAFQRQRVTREDVLSSRAIADPITLYQCTPNADGAAAVVVVSDRLVPKTQHLPVEIAALALHSGLAKDRFTGDSIVRRVARAVYAQAQVTAEDVSVIELHDAFAPAAIIGLENLGFAARGTAGKSLVDGGFAGGRTGPALNPSGGLLSRGHPPGATGLAQVTELVHQLRGDAGARQVGGAEVALLQTMGGTVLELETNACTVGILRRRT